MLFMRAVSLYPIVKTLTEYTYDLVWFVYYIMSIILDPKSYNLLNVHSFPLFRFHLRHHNITLSQ